MCQQKNIGKLITCLALSIFVGLAGSAEIVAANDAKVETGQGNASADAAAKTNLTGTQLVPAKASDVSRELQCHDPKLTGAIRQAVGRAPRPGECNPGNYRMRPDHPGFVAEVREVLVRMDRCRAANDIATQKLWLVPQIGRNGKLCEPRPEMAQRF